jgi:ribonuclease HII
MILGIDEAGRGPVLGPLVVAGVVLRPQRAGALTRRGVSDSKAFGAGVEARQKRSELAHHIRRLAEDVRVEVLDHREVDRYTTDGRLNELERRAARRIIDSSCEVKRIVADGARVFGPLCHRYSNLEALDYAESHHVAVAAASIIAKDLRDSLFEEIAERYRDEFGEIRGGGYVNAATADFLRRYHMRYQKLPPETRRTWSWKLLRELEPLPLPLFEGAGARETGRDRGA